MDCKLFSNLNIFLFVLLVFGKTSFGEECNSRLFRCMSCTDYEICDSSGILEGRTVSCKSGPECIDEKLKQCQTELNCYALNECTQPGIFPDVMVDSNFFVCLSDGATGFLKFEFSCKDDYFFDQSVRECVSRSVTTANPNDTSSPSPDDVIDPTDPTETTESTSSTSTEPTSSTSTESTSSTSTESTSSTSTESTSSTSTESTSSTSTEPTSSTTTESTSASTESTSSTSTEPTSSTPTESSSSTATETTPQVTPAPVICPMAGIFPVPDNCKMYYRCSTSLKPFYYICPGSSYFNEYILKCSLVISPACQQQILKNSTSTTTTTTPAPTSTTTTTTPAPTSTTTTTTPAPTSTTTTTTPAPTSTTSTTTTTVTTTTTTSGPFTCPTSGTFENPSDCKTYYRCSTSGKIFQYLCPGNTYFNEITKRCSLTVTPRCKNLIQAP